MKRIWGTNGDWYGVDFTIGSDPVMKYDKVKVKAMPDESLEAKVVETVAARHDVSVSDISIGHIIRMQS